MKQYSEEEIKDECERIWKHQLDQHGYGSDFEYIEIKIHGPNRVDITVSNMYEAPAMNSEVIFSLCEFFDTRKINHDSFSEGGCETCDYGSKYGFTLEITA